jgi:hypothetical protein
LQDRTPAQRKLIEEKLTEYRLMPPPLREWRLKATELLWYLTPLMKLPAGSRGLLLETVPAEDRPLVEARLQQWDRLTQAEQQELLNNEVALRYVSRPGNVPTPDPAQVTTFNAGESTRLEAAIVQWRSMSESQRQTLTRRFASFFNLTEYEQNRTLDLLTASERGLLRRQIESFADLDEADRARCLQALRRLSGMSRDDRLVFLQGAERWQNLSEGQRDTWRRLVVKLPPLPPGAGQPPMPPGMTPSPPGASRSHPPAGRALAADTR